MGDEVESLVLEHVRPVRSRVEAADERLDRIEMRLTAIARRMAGLHLTETNQSSELDALRKRMTASSGGSN